MKKIVLIITTLFLLTIIAAAIWAYTAFFYTKPLNQTELNDLTPDWSKATAGNWSPWFTESDGTQSWNPTASFNQWLATIPDDQKAWPVLIDISIGQEHLFDRELLGADPGTEEWTKLTQLLDQPETQATIARLTQALNRPHFGFNLYTSTDEHEHAALIKHGKEDDNWNPNPEPNPGLYGLRNTSLSPLQHATLLLSASAKHNLINNNPDAFMRQVKTIISHNLQAEFPSTSSWLVGLAMEETGYKTITWALQNHPTTLTDQHLSTLQSTIGDLTSRTLNWESPALEYHDLFRRIAGSDGSISPLNLKALSAISSPPTNLPDSALHPSLKRTLWVFNTSTKQAEPLSKFNRPQGMPSIEDLYELHKDSLNTTSLMLNDMFRLHLDSAATRNRMHIQNSFATQLTLAIHRHKLRHGDFPDSITAIDTDLLPITPIDAFSGQPLRYKLTESGPLIYSVGDDRTDNGGTQRWTQKDYGQYGSPPLLARIVSRPDWNLTNQEAAQKLKDDPASITGDWIIFPPPQDDPEPDFDDAD